MSYSIKDGKITLQKTSGGSPCSDEIGIYNFNVDNDMLSLQTVDDKCSARSTEFSQRPGFKRSKDLKVE